MENTNPTAFHFGMIGLGTMGRNLLFNLADHGFAVAGYDKNPDQVARLEKEKANKQVRGFNSLEEFLSQLTVPRVIMLLVPAGPIVDAVVSDLTPHLLEGDIIIDGGNSKFTDTDRRVKTLASKGYHFIGMGVSGGEEGARKGPSMMPGGEATAYQHVQPMFEAIAANVNGEPCVTYIGPGASGHFVKMVHNGIEYALMQLISETYSLLKAGLGFNNTELASLFALWNRGRLESYLMEITSKIFTVKNRESGHPLIDDISDEAKAKGTGKWTSQFAMELQVPVPSIDVAVSMRDLSKYGSLRQDLAREATMPEIWPGERQALVSELEQAFYFNMVLIYAQGLHLLSVASQEYGYHLNLAAIARIWRGGCIIRSSFLESIYKAYQDQPELEHLIQQPSIRRLLQECLSSARQVVSRAMASGHAVPIYATTLNYYVTLSSSRLPTNLIQAQRDFFGAHTYELVGKEGVFHTQWPSVS
ncbi:MAG: NADP-dependent phosphogluconate dehydrogenase [Saprospiraceae bacterium]